MSSIIVYGSKPSKSGKITSSTLPNPDNFYGRSKLEAEKGLFLLESKDFLVFSIRPPMIYGPGSKGNYPRLAKIAGIVPFFPKYENQRSMLYIDNLNEYLVIAIENEMSGMGFPQNENYVNTSELVKEIARAKNKNVYLLNFCKPFIKMFSNNQIINKVFGNLTYSKDIDKVQFYEYNKVNFKESIRLTEGEK